MKLNDILDNKYIGSNSNTDSNAGAKDGYDKIPIDKIKCGKFNGADPVDNKAGCDCDDMDDNNDYSKNQNKSVTWIQRFVKPDASPQELADAADDANNIGQT
jgi:hypothetical protein